MQHTLFLSSEQFFHILAGDTNILETDDLAEFSSGDTLLIYAKDYGTTYPYLTASIDHVFADTESPPKYRYLELIYVHFTLP